MASPVLVFVYVSVIASVITSCTSLHIPSHGSRFLIPSRPRSFDSRHHYAIRSSFNDALSHYYGPPPIANFEKDHFDFGRASSRRWERAFQYPKTAFDVSHFLINVPSNPGVYCPEGTFPDHSGRCRVPINIFKPSDGTPHKRIHEPAATPELVPEVVPEMATATPTTTASTTNTTSNTTTSTTPPSTFRAKTCNSTAASTSTTERSSLPGGVPLGTSASPVASSPSTSPSTQETESPVQDSSECVESAVEGEANVEGEAEGDGEGKQEEDKGLADAPLPVLLLLRDMPALLRLPEVEKLSGKNDRDLKKVLEEVEDTEESLLNNIIEK